jgi:hypothetical protein
MQALPLPYIMVNPEDSYFFYVFFKYFVKTLRDILFRVA